MLPPARLRTPRTEGVLDRAPKYGKKTTVTAESVKRAIEPELPAAPPKKRVRRTDSTVSTEFDEVLRAARGRQSSSRTR